jgi:hypothetical protein
MTQGASTKAHNMSGNQTVEQEAVDVVQEDPPQSYRSPLVNHFIQAPVISSIEITSVITPLLMPLPEAGAAIDDDVLDSLYYDLVVSRVSVALPQRKEIKSTDYVWFHLDTDATCTVSHGSGESHCPTPTSVKCGTATDGPSHVVKSLGYLIGDFETSESTMIPFEIPDHAMIPSFKRRLMSLHVLKNVGFDVTHSLLSKGNF